MNSMNMLFNYNLIGIGEFSHGIQESWEFRFNSLKYVNPNKKYQLITNYTEPLISFSNSYYKSNKYGVQDYINTNTFNYILFWNKVNQLN